MLSLAALRDCDVGDGRYNGALLVVCRMPDMRGSIRALFVVCRVPDRRAISDIIMTYMHRAGWRGCGGVRVLHRLDVSARRADHVVGNHGAVLVDRGLDIDCFGGRAQRYELDVGPERVGLGA